MSKYKPKRLEKPIPENLTTKQARELYLYKIPKKDIARVIAALPSEMQVSDYDRVVRYRNGCNPNTLNNLDPQNGNTFEKGNSASANRPTKIIREAYKTLATQIKESPVTKEKKSIAECLAEMHVQAIFHTFEKAANNGHNYAQFNKLSTDFRLSAGEIPTQENVNENKHVHQCVILLPTRSDASGKIELAEYEEVKQITGEQSDD